MHISHTFMEFSIHQVLALKSSYQTLMPNTHLDTLLPTHNKSGAPLYPLQKTLTVPMDHPPPPLLHSPA